jgi:hypothetical protein
VPKSVTKYKFQQLLKAEVKPPYVEPDELEAQLQEKDRNPQYVLA